MDTKLEEQILFMKVSVDDNKKSNDRKQKGSDAKNAKVKKYM